MTTPRPPMSWTETLELLKPLLDPMKNRYVDHVLPGDDEYDMIVFTSGERLRVHSRHYCRPPCPVHAPSDHPLRDAPRLWRADRRIVERRCAHGVGHPDPDDQLVRTESAQGVHGCDGCCTGDGPG